MSKPKVRMPCQRDLELFMRVVIQGHSLDEAAREFNIQRHSVEAMLSRVRTWMRRNGAVWDEVDEKLKRSSIMCELYLARLEHQWTELMNAWYRSTQTQEIKKGTFNDKHELQKVEVTSRSQTGNVRYLTQARVILETISEIRARRLSNINKEKNDDVEKATLEQRRVELTELLRLYGPGVDSPQGDDAVAGQDSEAGPPGDTRAA